MMDYLKYIEWLFNPAVMWLGGFDYENIISGFPVEVQEKIKAENLNIFSAVDRIRIAQMIKEYQDMKGLISKPGYPIYSIVLFIVIVIIIKFSSKKKGR